MKDKLDWKLRELEYVCPLWIDHKLQAFEKPLTVFTTLFETNGNRQHILYSIHFYRDISNFYINL